MNYIRLRKNNLCVENISASSLIKKYETPFYCYSLMQLKSNYHRFDNAFKKTMLQLKKHMELLHNHR